MSVEMKMLFPLLGYMTSTNLTIRATGCVILFLPLLFGKDHNLGSNPSIGLVFSMAIFYMHYFSDRLVWRQG